MARYATTETTYECNRCHTKAASREMRVERTGWDRNQFLLCPRCHVPVCILVPDNREKKFGQPYDPKLNPGQIYFFVNDEANG